MMESEGSVVVCHRRRHIVSRSAVKNDPDEVEHEIVEIVMFVCLCVKISFHLLNERIYDHLVISVFPESYPK